MTRTRRPRKPGTVLRELRAELNLAETYAGRGWGSHATYHIERARALIRELHSALRGRGKERADSLRKNKGET